MGFADLFKPKNEALAKKLQNKATDKPLSMPVTMPETIDFSALWAEPSDGGGLATLIPWINLGLLAVIAVKAFF